MATIISLGVIFGDRGGLAAWFGGGRGGTFLSYAGRCVALELAGGSNVRTEDGIWTSCLQRGRTAA
jgi:hypothetical protein